MYENIKTHEDYELLKKSGMFWSCYPELTGDWEVDKKAILLKPTKVGVLDYKAFAQAMKKLKDFMEERKKLDAVIKVISPTSTGVCEFGDWFIDAYIHLLEKAAADEYGWVSWFVFENDFGERKMAVIINGQEFVIDSVQKLFDVCLKKNGR